MTLRLSDFWDNIVSGKTQLYGVELGVMKDPTDPLDMDRIYYKAYLIARCGSGTMHFGGVDFFSRNTLYRALLQDREETSPRTWTFPFPRLQSWSSGAHEISMCTQTAPPTAENPSQAAGFQLVIGVYLPHAKPSLAGSIYTLQNTHYSHA